MTFHVIATLEEKATRTCCPVAHCVAQFRFDDFGHQVSHFCRRIKLPT